MDFQAKKNAILAKRRKTETFDWKEMRNGGKTVTVERDGFTCVLTTSYDYEYNFSEWRGEFTDKWTSGCINCTPSIHRNIGYKYFLPCTTKEDHKKELIKNGYAKGIAEEMARQYVLEDMKIAANPENTGLAVMYVTCECSKMGVVFGRDALHGIELLDDDTYKVLDEYASEVLEEALSNAKKKYSEILASQQ